MRCESNFPCYGINFVLFNHVNYMPENNTQPNVIFHLEVRARVIGEEDENYCESHGDEVHSFFPVIN